MSMFDAVVSEGVPDTNVYQSFNGKIYFAGYEIVRASRASVTITRDTNIYPEIGYRAGTVYSGAMRVRGSVTRAYINGVEWRLAIGTKPSSTFNPGMMYVSGGDGESTGDMEKLVADLGDRVQQLRGRKNSYPVKTTAKFEINSIDEIPVNSGASGYRQMLYVTDMIIDGVGLSIGKGGDLITSSPIDLVAGYAYIKHELIT